MTGHSDHNEDRTSPITNKEYWDATYSDKGVRHAKRFNDYRYYCDKLVFDAISKYYPGGNVLEVGAGGSDWLIDIASELKPSGCAGLDYSEAGCNLLSEKSKACGVNIDVVNADIFMPPDSLHRHYDFVTSFGVVEHFRDLPEVLKAIAEFTKPGGVLFTLIPNMAGVYGSLTKKWNRQVYDLHVPHSLESFVEGHQKAGLDIVWADYLGSSNFSVVSSCFRKKTGMRYWLYKQLTRLSKVIWYIESKTGTLPVSKAFSPYIVVVSRVPA